MGSGSGGGSSKISTDFTNLDTLDIEFVSGTTCPIIQIYNQSGELIEPEYVSYNLNNKITIVFGMTLTG